MMRLLLILLLLNNFAFAVTEFAIDVNCPEEDYNTLALAEDATDINLTSTTTVVFSGSNVGTIGDLATVTQYREGSSTGITATVAHTKSSQILLYGVSAGAGYVAGDEWRVDESNYFTYSSGVDSARVTINIHSDDGILESSGTFTARGATTDSTHYRKISVPESDRHNGLINNGARISLSGGYFYMNEGYLKVEYLAFSQIIYDIASSSYGIRMAGGYATLRNCFIQNVSNSASNNAGVLIGGTAPVVHNCIVLNADGEGMRSTASFASSTVYNCTIYNTGLAGLYLSGTASDMDTKNCLVIGSAGNCYSGAQTKTNCGSSDTTGTTGLTGLTATNEFTSIGSGTENLHLKAGATSIDAGVDLGAGYAIDIDGYTRIGTWDIGADEYVEQSNAVTYDFSLAGD